MAHIANMLATHGGGGGLKKMSRPELQISASVYAKHKGEPDMTKFDREDIKRLKAEIEGIEDALENWVPEDVAARAKRSLELDLDEKKARLAECKIRLKRHEVECEEVEDEKEKEEDSDDESEEEEY